MKEQRKLSIVSAIEQRCDGIARENGEQAGGKNSAGIDDTRHDVTGCAILCDLVVEGEVDATDAGIVRAAGVVIHRLRSAKHVFRNNPARQVGEDQVSFPFSRLDGERFAPIAKKSRRLGSGGNIVEGGFTLGIAGLAQEQNALFHQPTLARVETLATGVRSAFNV